MTKSGCVEEDFVMQEITNNKSILQKQPEYHSAKHHLLWARNL
jgi:hypothetical protein